MPKKIRLSADYQCYPLWWENQEMLGEINPETMPLRPETVARLQKWAEQYDSWMDFDNAPYGKEPDEEESEAFEQEGIFLWIQLNQELMPEYEVVYNSKKRGKILSDIKKFICHADNGNYYTSHLQAAA